MADPRPNRRNYQVPLDPDNPDHVPYIGLFEWLRQKRKLADYARDGVRLFADLMAGRVDVLLELFPWIPLKFSTQSGGSDKLIEEIEGLKRRVKELEQGGKLMGGNASPFRHLALDESTAADDQNTIVIRRDQHAGVQSAANFMAQANGLQQGGA